MEKYHKIQTIFMRDPKNKNRIITKLKCKDFPA